MQSKKRRLGKKRTAALLMCLFMLIPSMTGSADSISDTENKLEQLKSEKAELDSKLEALKDDEEKAVEYQKTLQEKITNVETQRDEVRVEIERLDEEILVLDAKIQKSQDELGDTLDLFYDSVKALYKSGSNASLGTLEILLDSSSLYEFSMKNEAMKSVTEYNQQITDRINEYLDETRDERTESQEKKEQVAQLKLDLEANQAELEELYEENTAVLLEIQSSASATELLLSENEAESEELIKYLEDLIAQEKAAEEAAAANNSSSGSGSSGGSSDSSSGSSDSGSGSSTSSGGSTSSGFSSVYTDSGSTSFAWPMPGVYYVSQHYGNGHYGIDIAGPYGQAIVAAESGTVITANNYDSWGDSWGYYVLIYHNGTYTTRYAHLSSLAVSYGQTVSRGQVVGYEGSTGNSTGPHLHFEVYQNGTRVNPWGFIS